MVHKIKATYNFNLTTMKKGVTKWIKLSEFNTYLIISSWISQTEEYKVSNQLLIDRIRNLIKESGFNFAFSYLKLCSQLCIQAINKTPLTPGTSRPWVKRDHYGFPTIIPGQLREILRDSSHSDYKKVVKSTLTLINIYRTFPTKVKPDLGTIIAPFDGLSRTLNRDDLTKVLKALRIRIYSNRFKGLILESAGPNGSKSTWNSGIDALAFIENPRQLFHFSILAISSKSYSYLLWLLLLILIQGPIYLMLRLFGLLDPIKLGKLSVVYDQAGKARIVAITNWWIQLALNPLHKEIYRNLEKMPTDGTFDQDGALNNLLLNRDIRHKFYSFDLSAATDRLPIDVQVQILDILGYRSSSWSGLLDFSWFYKGEYVKYSVGQPMGAYSSFAMLALTHHVIVSLAARRAGIKKFSNYAVLGDDIVINNDLVAIEYQHIMSSLGVSINLTKSLISSDLVEFAKRWKTTEHDYSPLGAGSILSVIRKPYFVGTLILEGIKKDYLTNPETLKSVLNSHPNHFDDKSISFALWAALGFLDNPHLNRHEGVSTTVSWYAFNRGINRAHRDLSLYHSLFRIIREKKTSSLDLIESKEKLFNKEWYSTVVSKGYALRLIERSFRIISPSFWLYYLSFPNDYSKALEDVRAFNKNYTCGQYQFKNIRELASQDSTFNGLSIDWRDVNAVKAYTSQFKKLEKGFTHYLNLTGETFYTQQYGFKPRGY